MKRNDLSVYKQYALHIFGKTSNSVKRGTSQKVEGFEKQQHTE